MRLAVAALASACALVGVAPTATAEPTPGCVSQFWMYGLRASTRIICDAPLRPDGSWLRGRAFVAPRFYVPIVCTGGRYTTYCNGGYWQEALDIRETYNVTPDTVLPDEPGHIPS